MQGGTILPDAIVKCFKKELKFQLSFGESDQHEEMLTNAQKTLIGKAFRVGKELC